MYLIIKICEFACIFLICLIFINLYKNNKCFSEILLKTELFHKDIKLLNKVNLMLENNTLNGVRITKTVFFLICLLSSILIYFVSLNIIEILMFNIIMAFIGFIIPFMILTFWNNNKNNKERDTFINMILQLKNYAEIENDIIFSFKSIENEVVEPFRRLIKKFIIEINSGVDVVKSLIVLKEKVNLKIGKTFFDNLIFCYLYGGNYRDLLNKTYLIMNEINEEQKKREQESKFAILILYIMIFIDILIYFTFIKSNEQYIDILQNNFLGNIIVCINAISLIFVVWLGSIIKKIDD